jgi:hypothetical protein
VILTNCDVCSKGRLWSSTGRFVDNRREMVCRNCGNVQLESPPQGLRIPPSILYVDIETALMSAYLYDLRIPSGYINKSYIKEQSFVINWAAAWLDTDWEIRGKIITGVVSVEEAKEKNDKRILEMLWDMLERADYWAGHNSDGFDYKVLHWRFLVNDLGFPKEGKRLDTWKMAGRYTRPPSRGLEYISTTLGGHAKNGLSSEEWMAIVSEKTPDDIRNRLLHKSNRYCRGDVREGVSVLRHYARSIEQSGKSLIKR